jgi:hypothetical protein
MTATSIINYSKYKQKSSIQTKLFISCPLPVSNAVNDKYAIGLATAIICLIW